MDTPRLSKYIGRRFGRLVVTRYLHQITYPKGAVVHALEAECDCGSLVEVKNVHLASGATKSCGCLRKEVNVKLKTTHGASKHEGRTEEYQAWVSMKGRCLNPNNKKYDRYGGRGITICDRWLKSFESFLADMGHKPEPKASYSLGRRDNDGDYCPENCRWETQQEQQNNRSTNHNLTIGGKTKTLAEWCEHYQIPPNQVASRIHNCGWDPIKAVTTPLKKGPGRPKLERPSCQVCGAPCNHRTTTFCSKRCAWVHRRGGDAPAPSPCQVCGEPTKKAGRQFCSIACKNKHQWSTNGDARKAAMANLAAANTHPRSIAARRKTMAALHAKRAESATK